LGGYCSEMKGKADVAGGPKGRISALQHRKGAGRGGGLHERMKTLGVFRREMRGMEPSEGA